MSTSAIEQFNTTGTTGPDEIEDSYALSPLQQGMLFHTLYAPQPGVEIVQFVFNIHAYLNVNAFKQAWQQLIDLSPNLRTSFQWEGLDEPLQRIHRSALLSFIEEDWRTTSLDEQRKRIDEFVRADRRRGFDLTRAPMMRVALFQIGNCDFHIVLSFHHALLEGRSLIRILAQVHELYDSIVRGVSIQFTPSRPYREYIDMLERLDLRKAESFWRENLRGFTNPTPVSAGGIQKVPADDQREHRERATQLSAELTSSLKAFALENGVTLYTLVEAAWALLLSRYSGQQDVVFGIIRASRSSFGNDEAVGLYINTIPVRINISTDKSVRSWLKELRARQGRLREYAQTPLLKIQEWCDLPSGMPLFESILVFENHDIRSSIQSHWENWEIRDFTILEQTNYPISLSGWGGESLLLKIEYERNLFDEATIDRMLGHLATMLQAMPAQAEAHVSDLPMLTAAERRQLLYEWNPESSVAPEFASVDQLFEEQAARTPNAVAVLSEEEHISYSDLSKRANQLAGYLQSLGVGPDSLVGISVSRSLEMIVGILGILKAGGAYVPLDAGYPRERLDAMLADARLTVLLTQRRLISQLPKTDCRVVCIDSDWEVIQSRSREDVRRRAASHNLAYVIYTSGSSGVPKGVLIEHRSLSGYVDFANAEFELTPADRVLQFASASFDTSAEEIFPCLATGATLVLRTEGMLHSISKFLQQCSDWEITVLDLPTAFWHELTAFMCENRLSLPPSVRLVIIGGEQALPERVEAWRDRVAPSARLLNTYGPTETTIVSTIADLSAAARRQEIINGVHVGRPIPHSTIYILDQHNAPVPVGVVGELHIGGNGLARGYLNRPELTSEKFVPDLFSDKPGARLYKTGDLARYSSDGSIQITGRADNQVKLNGFRIELGEIETALRSCEDVHDAIAAIREDSFERRRLVAYVVPSQKTHSLSALELRGRLRNQLTKKLPRHMVPSLFVVLNELPLTAHGKIDHDRLPAPEVDALSSYTHVRPRDPLEKQLAEIWEEILNVSPIGIKDNFFDLGGHSLLSVRMMSRVERITGERLSLSLLFEEATIEHLAAVILDQGKRHSRRAIVKVKEGGPKLPFFFLHGDFNGGGFYCRNLASGLGDDRPFYVIQPHGLDGGPIPGTIEQMAESHLRALQEVQPRGPYLLGGYCNGATIAFEMARLLKSRGERIDLLVLLCASVSGALRFKRLYDLVNRFRNVLRLGNEERAAYFLAYRERLTRVSGIRDYYKTRIAEFGRMRRKDQVGFVYGKTRTTLLRLGGILSPRRANRSASATLPVSNNHSPIETDRRQRATDAYTRAIMGYVPGSYVGPLTLLWPTDLDLDDPTDPTAGWSSVATSVDVQKVPGGHITCVTNHVNELAMMLKSCLNKLPSGVD